MPFSRFLHRQKKARQFVVKLEHWLHGCSVRAAVGRAALAAGTRASAHSSNGTQSVRYCIAGSECVDKRRLMEEASEWAGW